jgi:predicted ribosomally synthesized peptide with SipW-like signal peptide
LATKYKWVDDDNIVRVRESVGRLSGGATGGAGALVGRGTTALLSDEETFTGNSIKASENTAGIVDLEVDVENLQKADGIKYSINIPEGVNNNPSYIWVRAKTCPTPESVADKIEVELRVECESQTQDYEIGSGDLIAVVNGLRDGQQLKCTNNGGDRCFQPGENVDLVLEVTAVDDEITDSIEFQFEFYGDQCRYNTDAKNPFDSSPDCGTPQNAVSFIAFCSELGDSLAQSSVMVAVQDSDGNNDPLEVGWETDSPVDYVVVKSGQNFTIYDYRNDNTSSGTVVSGGDQDADFYGRVSGGAKNGFTEDPGGSGTGNSASSVPCELAADIVGNGDFPDGGTSYKLEWNGNEFEEES